MFEFKSRLTEEAYIDYNLYHMRHSKSIRRTQLIMRFLFPVLFLAFGLLSGRALDMIYWTIFILFSVGMFMWMPKLFENETNKRVKKMIRESDNGDMFGEKTYHFDEDGIRVSTDNTHNTYNWKSIVKIEESKTTVYLYVSSIQAIIVPKDSFESIEECAAFKAFIDEQLLKGRMQ